MEVKEELKYLRKKVNKLESTIQFIQNELQNKLGSVLERFLDQRASQLAKQKRAIQVEEDFCLDLLSCCADLQEEAADSELEDPEYNPPTDSSSKRKLLKTASDHGRRRKRTRRKKSKKHLSDIESNYDEDTFGNSSNSNSDNEVDNQISSPLPPSSFADNDVNQFLNEEEEDMTDVFAIKTEIVDIAEVDNQPSTHNEQENQTGGIKNYVEEELVQLSFIDVNYHSSVWKDFLREKNGHYAKCKYCNKILKIVQGSTSVLHHHSKLHMNNQVNKKNDQEFITKSTTRSFNSASISRKKKPLLKTLPTILDGKFFHVVKMDGNRIRASCQLCTKPKTIDGCKTPTSNFITHLKRVHPESFAEYENYLKQKREMKNNKTEEDLPKSPNLI